MYEFILFLGICSAFASGSQPPGYLSAGNSPEHQAESSRRRPERLLVPNNNCHKMIGCHFFNSEDMLFDSTLFIPMIDVNLCTHIFSSSASLRHDASIELNEEYMDINYRGFERINNLRSRNKHLKTFTTLVEILWDDHGHRFENKILFDPIRREALVSNIVDFVRKYDFNGIELQSHYLADHIADASDKQNFVLLLKELKQKFDENEFILALAVDGYERTANNYDIAEVSKYVSFINLRAYDFHGNSLFNHDRSKAGHIAPLYHSPNENIEEQKLNVDYIVKYWLSKGTPPNKLILGTSFHGVEYKLANPLRFGRGAPVVVDPRFSFPQTSYYHTCKLENRRAKWRTLWDNQQKVAYITRKKAMIAYENVASISLKAAYVKRMRLGGVLAYSIEADDFSGHCGGEKFTLLKAMNQVLRGKC